MSARRILIVAKRPPTRGQRGGDGDANICCGLIDAAARAGREVVVISFADELAGPPDSDEVHHVILPARHRALAFAAYPLHRTSPPAWQRRTDAAVRAVAEWSSWADVTYFHGISTFGLIEAATGPVVVHEIDPMSLSQAEAGALRGQGLAGFAGRMLDERAARDYRRLETVAARRAHTYCMVTESDSEDLSAVLGKPITAVPLGYDAPVVDDAPVAFDDRRWDLAFVGALNFTPNRHALELFLSQVVPGLRRQRPDLSVVVAGRRADDTIRALCAGQAELIEDPPDLFEIMASSRVAVFTNTFGRGERTTVRETLAQSTPVAGTPWSLRNVPVGPHLRTAPLDELDESILELLGPSAWSAAVTSARRVVAEMPSTIDRAAGLLAIMDEASQVPHVPDLQHQ